MSRRQMELSLLFTTRIGFYARLDWVELHHAVFEIPGTDAVSVPGRDFREADLPAVRALYDVYTAPFDRVTVRDEAYWRGQLRYAGDPDETFRLIERDGEIIAYARCLEVMPHTRAMEFARGPNAADALADLLLALAPVDQKLVAARPPDTELARALARRGAALDGNHGGQMWRVLDRPRLLRVAGADASITDASLLAEICGGDGVYWESDRF